MNNKVYKKIFDSLGIKLASWNPNPDKDKNFLDHCDCAIRGIMKYTNNDSWEDVYFDLCTLGSKYGLLPDTVDIVNRYLKLYNIKYKIKHKFEIHAWETPLNIIYNNIDSEMLLVGATHTFYYKNRTIYDKRNPEDDKFNRITYRTYMESLDYISKTESKIWLYIKEE